MNEARRTPVGRLLCIGDVHGCVRELELLLEAVAPGPDDQLVFLGDYVDRGPDSRATVEQLLDLRARLPRTVLLRGNHEEMMLGYLGLGGSLGEGFFPNGGAATLASYGIAARSRPPAPALARSYIPESHLDLLRQATELYFVAERYTFVHAGVRPGVPIQAQIEDDLLWIRGPFLSGDHGLPTTVVFGHTPQSDVWLDLPRRIGLDTGCVYGGSLSCLDLTRGLLHQVGRGTRRATARDVSGLLGLRG